LNKFKNKLNSSSKNNSYSKFKASTELDKNFDINKNKATNINKSTQLVKNKKKILEKRLQKKKNNRRSSLLPNNIILNSEFITNSTNTFKLSDIGTTSKFEMFNIEDVSKIYNTKSNTLSEPVLVVNTKQDKYNLFNDSKYDTLHNTDIPNPVPSLTDYVTASEKVNVDYTLHNDTTSTLLPAVVDLISSNNNTDLNIQNNNKIILTETNLNTDETNNVVLKKKKKLKIKTKINKNAKNVIIIKVSKRRPRKNTKGQHYRWFGDMNIPQINDLKATIEKRNKTLINLKNNLTSGIGHTTNLDILSNENFKFDLILATYINNIITNKSYLLSRRLKLKKKFFYTNIKIKIKKPKSIKFKPRTFRRIKVLKKKNLIKNYKSNKYQNLFYKYKNLFFIDKSNYGLNTKFFYKYNNLSMCIYFLKKFSLLKSLNYTLNSKNFTIFNKLTNFFKYKLFDNYSIFTNILNLEESNSFYTYSSNNIILTNKYTNQIILILFKLLKYENIKNSKFKYNFNTMFLLNFLPNFFIKRSRYNNFSNFNSLLYKSNIILPNPNFVKLIKRTRKK
jgi:hypothetical protein